jgi:hypothetical protein
MAEHNASLPPQTVTIRLEFVDTDPHQPDPATRGEVARRAVHELRSEGYTVQPAYTGTRGGDVFEIIRQVVQQIQDNQELLTALVSLATPIITHFLGRRASKANSRQKIEKNIEVEVAVDHMSADVRSEDAEDADRLLARLLQVHPNLAQTVTPSSTFSVRVHVPPSEEKSL